MWLDSVLFHEYIHGQQWYIYKVFLGKLAEKAAWGWQAIYLKSYLNKNKTKLSKTERNHIDELIDRAVYGPIPD